MQHLPFTASPRTKWQYCNLTYSAGAHLIETVTNQSLQSFLRDNIWSQLDMAETYLALCDAQDAHRDISQGYFVNVDGKITPTNRISTDILHGAGNILSSVSDYAKWISIMLNRGSPISPAEYEMLFGAHFIVSLDSVEPSSPLCFTESGGGYKRIRASWYFLTEGLRSGNNMNGVTAAANALAYHLIDEELGVPLKKRHDWVAREDTFMNNAQPSEYFISELYPRIPFPPLPNPLNFSAFEGSYIHPAYPELRISSSCTKRSRAYQLLNRTNPDLCVPLARPNDYFKDMEWGPFHVSGTYWLQITVRSGDPSAARAEFSISPDGSASRLGVEIEPAMTARGEKIWWKHV